MPQTSSTSGTSGPAPPASSSPAPSRKEIERCLKAAASLEKKRQQSPDRDSVISEFGRDCVVDLPDGSWTATIKNDRKKMKRASAMMGGVHKEESERGKEIRASQDCETVVMPDGSKREVYEHLVDNMRRKWHKGMRPLTGKYSPREHFGLSEAFSRYEQGPDGLWFIWNGGWEPTRLWRKEGLPTVQHDPGGNAWLEVNGEWSLTDEA